MDHTSQLQRTRKTLKSLSSQLETGEISPATSNDYMIMRSCVINQMDEIPPVRRERELLYLNNKRRLERRYPRSKP